VLGQVGGDTEVSEAPDAVEALGAEVVPYDRNTEDRAAIAKKIVAERGATLVPPYDDPLIIAGQGTIGREIVDDLERFGLKPDIVVVGAPGGGLAAGISLGVKARVPSAKFYTVEPEGFDDTLRSFLSGRRETNSKMSGTICDALMTATPGELTFPINSKLIGQGITASDAEVGRAVAYAFHELKLVVEPGGAIGLAALLWPLLLSLLAANLLITLIAYGVGAHADHLPNLVVATVRDTWSLAGRMGWVFVLSVLLRAAIPGRGAAVGAGGLRRQAAERGVWAGGVVGGRGVAHRAFTSRCRCSRSEA